MAKWILGNWKMNKTNVETKQFINTWNQLNQEKNKNVKIGIAVSYTAIPIAKFKNCFTYAQNISEVVNGAYTSQVSINQISQFKNIKGSLVGHSEVRSLLNDTDEKINQKIQNLTTNQLQAIFCIGETKEQYEQQQTNQIIEEQVKKGLSDITSEQLKYVIIAYEPIWAIGTGLIASNDTINQVCGYIKEILKNLYGAVGKKVIVVYGGSVKSSSSHDILNLSNVDGVLVGGGSLDPNEFYKIAKSI